MAIVGVSIINKDPQLDEKTRKITEDITLCRRHCATVEMYLQDLHLSVISGTASCFTEEQKQEQIVQFLQKTQEFMDGLNSLFNQIKLNLNQNKKEEGGDNNEKEQKHRHHDQSDADEKED